MENKKYVVVGLGISGIQVIEEENLSSFLEERDRLTKEFGHDQAVVITKPVSLDEAWEYMEE